MRLGNLAGPKLGQILFKILQGEICIVVIDFTFGTVNVCSLWRVLIQI